MAREGISPLPWSVSDDGIISADYGVPHSDAWWVTRNDGDDSYAPEPIDRAFIVDACNNYDRVLAQRDALLHALQGLTEHYTALVACGDCGNWDAEVESEVIAARAAIALVEKGEGH
jgi:hypothetical protein